MKFRAPLLFAPIEWAAVAAAADAPSLSKADYNRSVTAPSGGERMLRERGNAPPRARQLKHGGSIETGIFNTQVEN
jgi:hypothetical protein